MAEGTINIPKSGWSALETLHSETYGYLTGMRNPNLGIAILRWGGNSNSTPSSAETWDLNPNYKPAINCSVTMRNGDQIAVSTEGTIQMFFTGSIWSSCSIMYPTA